MLQADGHEVTIAENGNQALLWAVGNQYYVILTDSAMPGKSSIEFVKLLRAAQPNANVAVMSGQIYSADEKKSLRDVGAHAFLAKPFQSGELRKVVASLL
jgi:DNA-binding response OmpR family regulator